jgi:ABC-type dipeptide/oligopeptide/nickel transport system ATPase component
MGTIVGREGSGKSYTALKIANCVDESFNADRVIFDVMELLKVLRDGDHSPGDFYVLDEAGVSLGRRTWQDRAQVLANQALQLIRSHNLGLIFTLPRMSELDSQTEGRLQAVLEITEKRPEEYVKLKWKFVDPDRIDSSGNVLKKYPRRKQDGFEKRITRNTFAPPEDTDLIETYESRKGEFQDKVYAETIEALEDVDEEAEDDSLSVQEVADDIADGGLGEVVSEHGNTGEPYINHQLIRAQYDMSHDDAKAVKSILEQEFGHTPDTT